MSVGNDDHFIIADEVDNPVRKHINAPASNDRESSTPMIRLRGLRLLANKVNSSFHLIGELLA